MKRVRLLLGLLFVASSSVVSADDVDMFKRLQNPNPSVRLANAQDASSADVSDSFPTQYVDPEVLDDMATPLIEQEAVPAEAAAQRRIGGVADGSVIDPIASDVGVACGCGEGPLQQDSWDVAPCCPSVCVRRHGCCRGGGHGCHLTRRLHCLHARAVCEVAPAPVCVDPCAVDPCAVDPCAVDPCAVGHGCHLAGRRRGCHHGGHHRFGGGHGGHLLRHIRCCR